MENDTIARQPQHPMKTPNVGRIAVIIAILLFVVGLVVYVSSFGESSESTGPQGDTAIPATTPKATRVEGQIIVKFKAGVTDTQITERITPLHASIKSKIDGINATVLNVPPGQEDVVLQALANDPIVQYAEPDYYYYLQFTPNDPELSKQWAIVNTGQTINNRTGKADADIDADAAWDVSRGTGVKVAVLDSGIDAQHPDLASKVIASKSFITNSVVDENGHGTHVAGILAAVTNNAQGIAGVCPDCQLLIGKIANSEGSVTGSVIAPSITWAADSGAQVINMSIAGTSFSQAVQDAVNYAWGKNVVIVAAAGNTGGTAKMYPAAYANVVSVANTNNIDVRRTDSTHGPWVQIAAPGDFIYSTMPRTENTIGKINYGYLSGTSMASPAVAGVAALVWKTQYGTNNAAVVQRLYSTAEKISGTGSDWKNGRINAAAAVGANIAASTAPSQVPSPSVPFVCGGSTNSICPIPSTTLPVLPSNGNTAPTAGTNQPTNTVPSVNPNQPCEGGIATLAHNRKSKHKKRGQGLINRFVNFILRFFIEILNLILKLIGGGQIPVPNNPNVPTDPNNPNPCQPNVEPTNAPAEPTTPQTQPSTAQPSAAQPSLPISLAPSVPATAGCTNPVWTSTGPNDMHEINGYFVHNNAWGENPGPQTTYVCSHDNWYVTSTQTNSAGAVKTYPNVHKDINNLNGSPFSSFSTITSTFAATSPHVGIYNVAYDLWLNGVGWGNGTTEYMVWTENFGQTPLGSKQDTVTLGGKTYDAWHYNGGGANVVTLVANPVVTSGSVNLKEMISWGISKGWIPANPTVNQIDFGVEIVSTDGAPATFKFTNFSVTAN